MLSKISDRSFLLLGSGLVLLSSCSLSSPSSDIGVSAQFTQDTIAIRSYVTQNNIQATKLPSGVWFVVDSASQGVRAAFNDSLTVTYSTSLLANNSVVDHSTTPVTFVLSTLLPGIQYAMPQFQRGSVGRIFIPSYLGYQSNAQNTIPANSNLIFQFKLRAVDDHQLKLDTTAINAYLMSHLVKAISDPSGLHYTIDSVRSGSKPQMSNYVTINYTVKLMSSGQVVSQASSSKLQLLAMIQGFQIGMSKVNEGSKCTLYVPSSLGYGPILVNSIPENSNLIFSIQLLKVTTD